MLVVPQKHFSEQSSQPQSIDFTQTRARQRVMAGRAKLLLVTIVLCTFGVGLLFTSLSVQLSAKGAKIYNLKREVASLQSSNERLKLEVVRLQSLERIEQIATNQLGMIKPSDQNVLVLKGEEARYLEVALTNQHQNPSLTVTGQPTTVDNGAPQPFITAISSMISSWGLGTE